MSAGKRRVRWLATTAVTILLAAGAHAQSPAAAEADAGEPQDGGGDIIVTATRSEQPISNIPGSVTVLDEQDIRDQLAVSSDIGQILSKTVPGLGLATETGSDFGQALRGRNVLYLIDGVPLNFTFRDTGSNQVRIHPTALERVEVIRGASALYGSGAAGGIVNFITKKPEATPLRFRTLVGTTFSTERVEGSFRKRIEQEIGAGNDAISFFVAGLYEDIDRRIDAEGDIIGSGGTSDNSHTYNISGAVDIRLGETQRLRLSGNYFKVKQDRTYLPTGVEFAPRPARKLPVQRFPVGLSSEFDIGDPNYQGIPESREQTVATVQYLNRDIFGSSLDAQVFYGKTAFQNPFFSLLGSAIQPELKRLGTRITIGTPLSFLGRANLVWGLDYINLKTDEQVRGTGLRLTPESDQDSSGLFAQLELPIGDRLLTRAGVRYERFVLDVPTYTVFPLPQFGIGGNVVEGGTLKYDAVVFNAGAVYKITPRTDLFAGFSQGFNTSEVGDVLRFTDAPSVEIAQPDAQKVNNYEIGVRQRWQGGSASIAAFYSTSKLGTTFVQPEGGGVAFVERAPERIYGIEATIDAVLSDKATAGGTIAWQEGKRDPERDDDYTPLPGSRIAPLKATAYASYSPAEWWQNRAQITYSGSRNEFPGSDAYLEGRVKDFVLLDLFARFKTSIGEIELGVSNALNEFYFPPISYASNEDDLFLPGEGRTITLNYRVTW